MLAHAIRLKGHLKLKKCVPLEQTLSHLTHTMQIILWIDIYIMFSVCGLKSLFKYIASLQYVNTLKKTQDPLQERKSYHHHFAAKLLSHIQSR